MKELLNDIETLISEELERANKDNPLFHSRHEGLAVIEEEVWETMYEITNIEELSKKIRVNVFYDSTEEASSFVKKLRRIALLAAAELVQVAAMCDKWEMSVSKWSK